ncbi:YceI family protein [uncultured Thiohalocapsa sp.]|uniref:YceI family protein n=1 Tax=uncultured Thiohalocapsa sp. TaxID=768990 RepID=UPI0025FA6F9B|nr:YceI family protein [uncultured Thiohalocapsa sp.]
MFQFRRPAQLTAVPHNGLRLALTAAVAALALAAGPVAAGWSMDPTRSHLSFVSIKAKDVGEVNTFKEMTGTISDDGQVTVSMFLDSVETLIPIRNERMREFLFETTNYKDATLSAKVEPATIAGMEPGQITPLTAEGNLSLHGSIQPMIIEMQAVKLADGTVMVASTKPLIVDAAKFGLSDGVETLREIAGLDSISHAVPVTFVMTFVPAQE